MHEPHTVEKTRVLAACLRLYLKQQRKAVLPVAAACAYLVLLCRPHVAVFDLLVWAACAVGWRLVVFYAATRLLAAQTWRGREHLLANALAGAGFVSGVAAGAIAPLYFGALPFETRAIATMIMVAWVVAALLTNAALPRAYVALMMPFTLAVSTPWLSGATPEGAGIAVLLAILFVLMLFTLLENNRAIVESILIRFENQALVLQLKDANAKAEQARAAAENANIAKSKFLAAASHDLRQPLNALSLLTGLLMDADAKASSKEVAIQLDRSVQSMDTLFEALLDLSKLDAGAVEPTFRNVDVHAQLTELAAEYRGKANAKGLTLECIVPALWVRTDRILFERLMRNLLDNAVKYTPAGSIEICVRSLSTTSILIEVADTGLGIHPDHHQRIFEEFYQVGNQERRRSQGLGLGLALVSRLASLLGASVYLRSQPGRGTTFSVEVPAGDAEPSQVENANPLRLIGAVSVAGATVIAIDDDVEEQDAMRLLLDSWGAQPVVAGSVRAAVAKIEAMGARPTCAICDYRLGGDGNGIDAVRFLRATYPRIPALLISGDTAVPELEEIMASGLELMHKPASPQALKSWIARSMRENTDNKIA